MRVSGGFKTGLFVLALAIALFNIALLGISVAQQVDRLSKASSGDGLWHLSQVEVDYRRLTTALAAADSPKDYGEIRHRFDVFFSRVLTLSEGGSYQQFRDQPAFAENLSEVMAFLTDALGYIDANDEKLSEELGGLIDRTNAINGAVRQMAVTAVVNASQRNEELRNETRGILIQLLAATMALIAGLIIAVIILRRLYGQSRLISDENELARARIASMIHASLDGILVTDPDGHLLEMNRAAERMFQTTLPTGEKIHLNDLIVGTTSRGQFDDPARSGLLVEGRIQTQAKRKNGIEFPVEISLVSAKVEKRSYIYVVYVRDISSRLKAEDTLRQARDEAQAGEKAKARLLAVMSHEIRTPLNGVLGAADLLSNSELDAAQRRYVEAMQTSGSILESHINDVLELSKLDDASQPRQFAPIALHQLVPEIIVSQHAFAEQNETDLDLKVFRSVPDRVMGDKLAIQQVLLNLVSNAIKFSAGGSVYVEVDHFGEGEMIVFRVIDDGIGIEDDEIDKVFDDFYASDTSFARAKQGTGLGLGIAKRIVTAMDGVIGAESIPGEGSMFWFRLPMKPADAEVLPKASPAQIFKTTNPSEILLVEDNAINRMIATDMLQNAGHKVTQADNGAKGVAIAKEQKFDLILMDISMPDMDGLTAADLIHHSDGQSNDTPIIALTAQPMVLDDAKFAQHGILQVLRKPLTSQALTSALETILTDQSEAKWAPLSKSSDQVLDLKILQDVIANIGLEKTQQHFKELETEMEVFTGVGSLQVNGAMVDAPTAHRLAGAAAVIGLCALYRQLSKLEAAGGENNKQNVQKEWAIGRQAISDHLQSLFNKPH